MALVTEKVAPIELSANKLCSPVEHLQRVLPQQKTVACVASPMTPPASAPLSALPIVLPSSQSTFNVDADIQFVLLPPSLRYGEDRKYTCVALQVIDNDIWFIVSQYKTIVNAHRTGIVFKSREAFKRYQQDAKIPAEMLKLMFGTSRQKRLPRAFLLHDILYKPPNTKKGGITIDWNTRTGIAIDFYNFLSGCTLKEHYDAETKITTRIILPPSNTLASPCTVPSSLPIEAKLSSYPALPLPKPSPVPKYSPSHASLRYPQMATADTTVAVVVSDGTTQSHPPTLIESIISQPVQPALPALPALTIVSSAKRQHKNDTTPEAQQKRRRVTFSPSVQ